MQDFAHEVGELAHRIFADVAAQDGVGLDRGTWKVLGESGLTDLFQTAEGPGEGWPEAAALLVEAGAAGARIPIVEHDLLGGWLLRRAGLPDDGSGPRTCGTSSGGVARAVPWAREAASIVLLDRRDDGRLTVLETGAGAVEITPGENLAGEYRDDVRLVDGAAGAAEIEVDAEVAAEYAARRSLARTLMIAGASARVLEIAADHAVTREQFGRRLAKFQAVQHLVTTIAAETALIRAAADGAVGVVRRAGTGDRRARVAILAAASCAAHGASVVARNAHQVLGAMGCTREHPLHRSTQRVLSWRSENGSVHGLDAALLRETAGLDPTDLWSLLVDAAPSSEFM
ncbi:acyl-CoA dehydrogenase family protein [Actinocorallia aurantiaca]|uniref:Acyl-CoA dehydrogenase family protein n=1 Tax=Actinocorallia aurantiaca TaxID=46204 RepID=A0ABN3UP65_9ACTN